MRGKWIGLFLTFYCIQGFSKAPSIKNTPEPYRSLETLYPYDDFGWFGADKKQILRTLMHEHGRVRTVIELGSFLGQSTRFFAREVLPGGKVYAVDHWLGSREHHDPAREVYPKLATLYEQFLSNVVHAGLCKTIVPLRMTTLEAAMTISETPDLIFLDASHEYEDVLEDLEAWYPKLPQGGLLVGDDWTWGEHRPVQNAVIAFCEKYQINYCASGRIWWIQK